MQLCVGFAVALLACGGRSPHDLASHDIPTVFFISKSDDHNRVDYGMRLGPGCLPPRDAVFPYWHEFEPTERTHALGAFEDRAYGIEDQHVVSRREREVNYLVKLKRFDRAIIITTTEGTDGRCSAVARVRLDGTDDAVFTDAFAQLGGLLSVDYIELHGSDPKTGVKLVERIKP